MKKTIRYLGLSKAVLFIIFAATCFSNSKAFANGFLITGGPYGGTNWENLCLDVVNGQFFNGAHVQSYTCNGTNAQKWVTNMWDGFPGDGYTISPAVASGYCLDVPGWNFSPGQYLQIWGCTGGTNQRFCCRRAALQSWRMTAAATIITAFPSRAPISILPSLWRSAMGA